MQNSEVTSYRNGIVTYTPLDAFQPQDRGKRTPTYQVAVVDDEDNICHQDRLAKLSSDRPSFLNDI